MMLYNTRVEYGDGYYHGVLLLIGNYYQYPPLFIIFDYIIIYHYCGYYDDNYFLRLNIIILVPNNNLFYYYYDSFPYLMIIITVLPTHQSGLRSQYTFVLAERVLAGNPLLVVVITLTAWENN